MRTCPRDGSRLRAERWRAGLNLVEVDGCPTCRGLFLDEGEIRLLTGSRNVDRLVRRPRVLVLDSTLRCPSCKEMMEGVNPGSIRVDVCLGCSGAWLDARELQRLHALATTGTRNELKHRRVANARGSATPSGETTTSAAFAEAAARNITAGKAITEVLSGVFGGGGR